MKKIQFLSIAILSSFVIACGGKKEEEKKDEGFQVERANSDDKKEEAANTNTVALAGNDSMLFDKNELRVEAGKPVTLTLRHTGVMQKISMGHNFVLLKQGTNVAEFAGAAASARDTDYIPADSDAVIAHTKMLGGGESDTITFDAPAPGTYDYICSFPGHYAVMRGTLVVE